MSDKEFTVEIDLLVDEKVSVETDLEMTESTELDLDLTLTGGSSEHQKLTGRNLPDQHPIEAISGLEEALHGKVNIEAGKLLTSNDFTNEYKEKLDSVEKNAEVNIIEHIWVNGEPQEVLTDRVVDLYMPTTTKELNDTDNVVYRDNDQVIYGEKTFEANVNIGTSEDLKFLDLKGSEAISQNLKVDGDVSIGGSVEILGETSIDNNVIIEGDLNSNKTLTVEGTTNLKSDVTLDKKLSVTGEAELKSDLEVTGQTTLKDNVTAEKDLSVTGETRLNSALEVIGQTTLKDNVTAEKDLSVEGSLTVTGDLELNGGVIIDKDLTVKGTTTLESEVELKKSLTVDGVAALKDNVTLDKNLRIVGSSTLESQVDIKGVANITNNVNVVGDLNISGNISQKGENYETHAEQVYSTSDYITLRDGAVSSLLPEEYSGFEINLYDGTNTGRLVIDNTGTARVGDVGDEQPLLTREESSSLVDGGLLVWDAENSRAKTTQEYSKTSEFDDVAFSGDYADLVNTPTKLSDFTDDTDTNPIKKAQTLKDLTITSSTLNLLSGATSNVQEQLNQLDKDLDTAQENLSKEISDTKTEIENTIQPKLDELDQEIDTKVNIDDMVEVDIDGIKSDITNLENTKQDNLTSANAGDGISIVDGIISNTRVSAEWGNIQGDILTQTDLQNALNAKQNTISDLATIRREASTALQPNDDITQLNNNAGYITSNALTPYATKASLADVATSGSYNDLTNKPTIPTVNNGTLTIQKNGTSIGTFTANQSGNSTINIVADEVLVDNKSITKNGSDQLQAVGVLDSRDASTALKYWTGTRSQYDAIATKDNNTLYNITDDTDVTLTLLEILYPVGAIYIGTMATCPLQILGVGNWVLKASDRVLQGAGANSAGNTVEAGLPNITGTAKGDDATGSYKTANGAFSVSSSANVSAGGFSGYYSNLSFDASRSSSIYGNSTTVQPPAYIVNIWERIN